MPKFNEILELAAKMRELIIADTESSAAALATASGYSARTVQNIQKQARPSVSINAVKDLLANLPEGRVTSYGEIGRAITGRKGLGLVVANVIMSAAFYPAEAARVIKTSRPDSGSYRMSNDPNAFVSHHGVESRAEGLTRAGIPHVIEENDVLIKSGLMYWASDFSATAK